MTQQQTPTIVSVKAILFHCMQMLKNKYTAQIIRIAIMLMLTTLYIFIPFSPFLLQISWINARKTVIPIGIKLITVPFHSMQLTIPAIGKHSDKYNH